jgi:ABC-type sulfate/molybdate transport systems ATPase subunit
MKILALNNIHKSFDGRLVLNNASLVVRRGESVALLGSNGCGKSTLLKCCNGLVHPDQGEIILDGQCLSGMKEAQLRKARSRIGFVF